MNPLISLVIPVYNVEKYLRKCLDSVLAQTYDNFEVILVDDGSTDASGKICDEYAQKYSRIIVYHKQNGGLSDARNFGVEHCNADLVSFIDSDDYVTENYLQCLWDMMVVEGVDLSVVGMQSVLTNGARKAVMTNPQCVHIVFDAEQALKAMFYGTYFGVSACAKLFRKEMLLTHPFPVGALYEDLLTTYKIVADCDRVAYDGEYCYFYLQRTGSIRHGAKLDERYWNAMDQASEIVKYFNQTNTSIAKACKCRFIYLSLEYMNFLQNNNTEDKQMYKRIKSKMKQIVGGGKSVLFDPSVTINAKIKYCVVCMGYLPMRLLWRAIDLIRGRTYKNILKDY